MENNTQTVATAVLQLMKRSIKRMYTLLIIFVILLVISIVDSIYQRCRIIDILEEYEIVEEVTETYELTSEGNNNFIGGDNNGEVNN